MHDPLDSIKKELEENRQNIKILKKAISDRRLNRDAKKRIIRQDNINKIAKAVTHFAFRNGVIENMHADKSKNITDEDMKVLNKFMVNRLAFIFELIISRKWFEFEYLIETTDKMYGRLWDKAIPDDGGIEDLFMWELLRAIKKDD